MKLARPAYASDPRDFGRRGAGDVIARPRSHAFGEDLRLFALTFAAGFLFVSIMIG